MFSNLPERDDDRPVLVRIAVDADRPGDAELLGSELFELGATGIEETDDDGTGVLLAGFPNRAAALTALAALAPERRPTATVDVPADTWFDGWRAYARPQRAGRGLIVHPPWVPLHTDPPVGPDDIVLEIDPGRSFGSGAHPTTRLVLAELERLITPGCRLLDLGCGSGVLAIAAVRLGATDVLAVDTDPEAIAATRANQRRNGVDFVVLDALGPVPGPARYDLVAANIGANTLIGLADTLLRWGSTLVLSGFFAGRADEVTDAYARCGASPLRTMSDEDGWTVLTLAGPSAPHRTG